MVQQGRRLSIYYQAALRVTVVMADDVGETGYARGLRQIANRGRAYAETRLFNGEYFFHEADPKHPESQGSYNGCAYSQLPGQSQAYQVGLEQIVDQAKVTTALNSLRKYNFSTDVGLYREKCQPGRWYAMPGEAGLIACTWPYGGHKVMKRGNADFSGCLNECQVAYDYGCTSLMIWHIRIYGDGKLRTQYAPKQRIFKEGDSTPWNWAPAATARL